MRKAAKVAIQGNVEAILHLESALGAYNITFDDFVWKGYRDPLSMTKEEVTALTLENKKVLMLLADREGSQTLDSKRVSVQTIMSRLVLVAAEDKKFKRGPVPLSFACGAPWRPTAYGQQCLQEGFECHRFCRPAANSFPVTASCPCV